MVPIHSEMWHGRALLKGYVQSRGSKTRAYSYVSTKSMHIVGINGPITQMVGHIERVATGHRLLTVKRHTRECWLYEIWGQGCHWDYRYWAQAECSSGVGVPLLGLVGLYGQYRNHKMPLSICNYSYSVLKICLLFLLWDVSMHTYRNLTCPQQLIMN